MEAVTAGPSLVNSTKLTQKMKLGNFQDIPSVNSNVPCTDGHCKLVRTFLFQLNEAFFLGHKDLSVVTSSFPLGCL
jgi:hypothetical protein